MDNPSSHFFLFADAHLTGGPEEERFFRLLDQISGLPRDYGVVFLGDIFELWVALPNYENDLHDRFLRWCRKEKEQRTVVFLEGNHEFYAPITHARDFSVSTDLSWQYGPCLFMHGDLINRSDWKYRLLRIGIRNWVSRSLLRLTSRWFGPALTRGVLKGLKKSNMIHKLYFPERHAIRFLARISRRNQYRTVIMGHFHERRTIAAASAKIEVLPAYAESGEWAFVNGMTGELTLSADAEISSGLVQPAPASEQKGRIS